MLKFFTLVSLLLISASPVFAESEKIDPNTYICAEFIASSVDGQPPLFESLQIDGYASALANINFADAESMRDMIMSVYDSCSPKPAEKVLTHWQEARKNTPPQENNKWVATSTTCEQYAQNTDDGSGFIIWLDGWQRARNKSGKSVFADQETLDKFLAACNKDSKELVVDVMQKYAQ